MTDKMKHTPGPWVSCCVEPHGTDVLSKGAYGVSVAWCGANAVFDIKGSYAIGQMEAAANARLIAAAPELLEALREALEWMESDWQKIDYEWGPTMEKFGDLEGAIQQRHPSTDAIRPARAAIAKATGINDAP